MTLGNTLGVSAVQMQIQPNQFGTLGGSGLHGLSHHGSLTNLGQQSQPGHFGFNNMVSRQQSAPYVPAPIVHRQSSVPTLATLQSMQAQLQTQMNTLQMQQQQPQPASSSGNVMYNPNNFGQSLQRQQGLQRIPEATQVQVATTSGS